jgi:hypothetical protein
MDTSEQTILDETPTRPEPGQNDEKRRVAARDLLALHAFALPIHFVKFEL